MSVTNHTNIPENDIPENGGKAPALWGWHTVLSIGITIAVFIVLAAYVDFRHFWRELTASNKWLLLLAGLSHYATYPVRGMRWKYCLRHLPLRCSKARFGLLVFFYNFVDNLVPAKLGDLYAAHLARINCGIRRSSALGSILFLRTLDAWVVFGLAALASWQVFSGSMPTSVVWALIIGCVFAVAATVIMLVFVLLKRKVPGWFPEAIRKMIEAFRSGMWPKPKELIPIVALTGVIWGLEVLWILLLALSFNLVFGTAEIVFLTMIPMIASAFPITPAGAGVVELTLFTCLRVIGVSSPLAVSVTVVNRFIDYWLHIFLGGLTWSLRRSIGLRSWKDVPPVSDQSEYTAPGFVEKKAVS